MWLLQLQEEDNDDLKALINKSINKSILQSNNELS